MSADDLFPPTLDEQIACVEREIKIRERVYPRRIEAQRMRQATADREIRTMTAVLDSLKWMKDQQR